MHGRLGAVERSPIQAPGARLRHEPSLASDNQRRRRFLETLAVLILDALGDAHQAMLEGGFSSAVRELNAHWATERPVEITLISGEKIGGRFMGLDHNANLRVLDPRGQELLVAHHHVAQLKELA